MNAKKSSAQIYLRLLKYMKPYIGILCVSVLGYALAGFYTAKFIELLDQLIKNITPNDPSARTSIPLDVIIYTGLRSLGAFVGTYYLARVSLGIVHRLRMDVFERLTTLPNQLFDVRNSSHLISVITYNINGVTMAVTDGLRVLLQQGAMVVFLGIQMVKYNWQLTTAFVVIAPLIAIIVTYAGKRMRRLTNKVQVSVGGLTQVTTEMIGGIKEMRSFGAEEYEKRRFEDVSQKNYWQNMKIIMTSAASTPLIQMLVGIALATLIYIALTYADLKSPGTFVAYLTAVGAIINPIRKLGEISPLILKGVAAAESVFQLLDERPEKDGGTLESDRVTGAVVFKKVNYAYPDQESQALSDVSLDVGPGEIIALVGKSGGGKSTLVNLLPRFYDIQQGDILLDGQPIQNYTLANLRKQIAIVTQKVTLFEGTVADNIAYGRADQVTAEAIKRAADLAYATEFIERLPQGFATQIGEGGARLSGGQRQRLAIARAILKDAPILIMDEATSALDNESERFIQAAMDEVMKGRTTFVIAHRLSTVEHANRIVVMDEGKIVEVGCHKELLAQSGVYAKLHAAQFYDEINVSN